jgi:hypothetical protein
MRLKKMNGEFTFGPKGLLKWSSQDGLISFCELDFWVLKLQLGGQSAQRFERFAK